MKKKTKEGERDRIERFYANVGKILNKRGIRWKDLAKLIGVSANTMSSSKSQKVNPPLSRIIKIADALEVSIDELIGNRDVAPELYDIFWTVPQMIKSVEKQEQICTLLTPIINLMSGFPCNVTDRNTECNNRVKQRLEEMGEKTE